MKFNVKIIPIGKYLSKYNIFLGDTKTISNEDGAELTKLLKAYEDDSRYPIYLSDSIIVYRELNDISAQFLITDISANDENEVVLTLSSSKNSSMYSISVVHNVTNNTYTLSLKEM